MTNNKTISFYFHIPFCVRKCHYCDFLSAPADDETKNAYMQALLTELEESREEYDTYLVTSIFFGGGTPSVVDPVWIEKIISYIMEHFRISDNIEITIEVNPGTADENKLRSYRHIGVNRLSIGLQSANNTHLRTLGRIHTFEQFLDTYRMVSECGFDNVNVDIMGALPGQTFDDYRETIKKVVHLNPAPKHISLYSLILEENTLFWKWYENGKLLPADEANDRIGTIEKINEDQIYVLPDEDMERTMYAEGNKLLKEYGYEHYEISNYAQKGFECRHNVGYWTRQNYVGFGIGAASLVENKRFQNTMDLQRYLSFFLGKNNARNDLEQADESKKECFESGKNGIRSIREEVQVLSVREQMEEFMFLGLRMMEGVSKRRFLDLFGVPVEEVYGETIRRFDEEGLLVAEENSDKIYLTEKGIDLDNYVSAGFLKDDV